MSCGVPVVYGNRGALPEVVGEGGLSADPGDVDEISGCFVNLIGDAGRREALARKALERAARFSWDSTVRKTLDVYRSLLAGPPAARAGSSNRQETTVNPKR